jgi:uncharacterized protein YidB (DUF937 family)
MGLLDALFGRGKAAGGGTGGDPAALIQAVLGMLAGGGQGGGLQALVRMFQGQGMGDLISSWIGTGRNLPVSADQVKRGLGPDLLSQLSAKAGMAPDAAASNLAELLPALIDKLTPNGNAPNAGLLQAALGMLAGGGLGGGGRAGGGLGALMQAFQGQGMEDLMSSWIGTGDNLPASADQMKRGLGPDLLSQIASKAGMAPDDAASGLSELLPGLIDQVTPGGKVPDLSRLREDMDSLGGFLSKI